MTMLFHSRDDERPAPRALPKAAPKTPVKTKAKSAATSKALPVTRAAPAKALPRAAATPSRSASGGRVAAMGLARPVQQTKARTPRTYAEGAAPAQLQQNLRDALFSPTQQRSQPEQQEQQELSTLDIYRNDVPNALTSGDRPSLLGVRERVSSRNEDTPKPERPPLNLNIDPNFPNPARRGGGPPAGRTVEEAVREYTALREDSGTQEEESGQLRTDSLGQLASRTRNTYMSSARRLSQEEFDALTPRQQAAVHLNTGLVEAATKDRDAGTTSHTLDYLSELGIEPRTQEELDSYLSLRRMIPDDFLDDLNSPIAGIQLPHRTGAPVGPSPTSRDRRLGHMRGDLELAGKLVAQRLSATGSVSGGTPVAGFGSSAEDVVIQDMYLSLIDANYELSTEDIQNGLAWMNEDAGTNVDISQVWDFTRANLDAVKLGNLGSSRAVLDGDGLERSDGSIVEARDAEDVIARYGL